MIIALLDLFRFKRRLGRYSDDPNKNLFALGHTGRIGAETLAMLQKGDMILCQGTKSLLSWAIMYFGGNHAVDHVAVYIGNGTVLHMTLLGSRTNSIHLLARRARVLPFRLLELDVAGTEVKKPKADLASGTGKPENSSQIGHPPPDAHSGNPKLTPHLQLLLSGIEIMLGLRPTSFRWKYYIDLGLFAALIDLALWPINQFPVTVTMWVAWLIVIIRTRMLFRRKLKLGHKIERDSHPGLALEVIFSRGGYLFPSQPIKGEWKVRVLAMTPTPFSKRPTEPQSRSQQSNQENSTFDQ